MSEVKFPKSVPETVAALADLCRHQGKREIVEVLENAHTTVDLVEVDNYNGGTYYWGLRLEVSVSLFASIEPRLEAIEKEIVSSVSHFLRSVPNHGVTQVTISPQIEGSSDPGQRMSPSAIEIRRLWAEGYFRLFLSHVSKHKTDVSKLKNELELYGIDGFVAHEDIEPSLEWQKEIEVALRSAHALAALVTPDFHASKWTDHEVGWSLARGILVVPIRLGADPYGLFGKLQGAKGALEQPGVLAKSMAKILLGNHQTHVDMRQALSFAFTNSKSYAMSHALCPLVTAIDDFTEEERQAIRDACENNTQVRHATGVSKSIFEIFGKPEPAKEPSNVPF